MNNSHLTLLKFEIEGLINKLDVVMADIKRLDKFVNDVDNDPDAATLMVDMNVPVDFSYVKLLNQILKG